MPKSTPDLLLSAALLTFLASLTPWQCRAADEKPKAGEWPAGWLFRVPVTLTEAVEAGDITLDHGGLGQFDGRDVRVVGPQGEAVSALISALDATHVRVIFEGAPGAGKYFLYFGNPSPKLPPPPAGVSVPVPGRADWAPKGGFTCVSYNPLSPLDGKQLVSQEKLLSYYERVMEQAKATPPLDEKAPKNVISGIYVNAAQPISAPDQYFHIFRAEIEIETPGKYDLLIANALSSDRIGVIFVDGDRKTAAVQGWYVLGYGGSPFCSSFTGQVELKAGKHVLEMYTNRRNPEIRMGLAGGTSKVPEYLGGQFASYEAKKVAPGEMEAAGGDFVAACHTTIAAWLAQNRFPSARAVCRFVKQRFAANPQTLKEFSAAYERVNTESYERNWLTEGKYATRAGTMPDVDFFPPFIAVPQPISLSQDDRTHCSSCVWGEGKLIYGLPFNVQDAPWGVTSSIAVEDNLLFVGTKNGAMHAVELANGSERWNFTSEGECVGSPLVYCGVLYYGTLDRRLYAIDIARGRMLWNFPARGWIEGGPCAADGRVYFGSLDKSLYAIDAALGIQRWETPLDGPISAPPTTDGKNVYVGTRTGTFYAVDSATGKEAWHYAAGASIEGGSCVDKKRVVFGDKAGHIHCVDHATGQSLWKAPATAGGPVTASPILLGSVIYGGTADGKVFGIDAGSGEVGWHDTLPAEGEISRSPIFADGKLCFTSKMRGLFSRPTGQPALVTYQPGLRGQQVRQPVAELSPDGLLDEPSWNAALTLPLLKPNGFEPAARSEARFLWDAKHLYVGVSCRDAADEDNITVVIDPRGDGAVAYQFSLTRAGVASTALLTAPGGDPSDPKIKAVLDALKLTVTGADWKPQWLAKSSTGSEGGWTAELVIPFDVLEKQIAPPPQHGTNWRVNVIRNTGKPGTQLLAPTRNKNGIGAPMEWLQMQYIPEKVKP